MVVANDMAGSLTSLLVAILETGIASMLKDGEELIAVRGDQIVGMRACSPGNAAKQNGQCHEKRDDPNLHRPGGSS